MTTHKVLKLCMLLALVLSVLPATASGGGVFHITHINHILYILTAVIATWLLLMLFRNRFFVFRERELDKRNSGQMAQMALVLQASKARVWIYDTENQRYIRLARDGTMTGEYSPIDYSQFYESDDFQELRHELFSIRDGQATTARLEVRGRKKKNSRQKQFEVKLKILETNRSGRPKKIMALQRDISADKVMEEKVSQMLMQFHSVFNHSMVDMAYYDANGVLADANEQLCHTFGFSSRQALLSQRPLLSQNPGLKDRGFDGTDTHFVTRIELEKDLNLDNIDSEHQNGLMYYEMTFNGIVSPEGKLLGSYSAGRNVTEMVEAYHRQQEVRRQLSHATERIHIYIDNINYALEVSGVRLVNYYPKEHMLIVWDTLNKPQYELSQLRCLDLIDIADQHHAKRIMRQMDGLKDIKIEQTLRTVMHDEQNRRVWLAFSMVPVTNADGQISHYFGMCRNETEMIYTEQKLKDETQKAQETELLKDSFLMNMSHEIRTPLNAVLGFADLFNADHDPADEAIFVEQIKENSNKLLDLVNDVLFLSRLDAHMIEFKRQPTDFASLFNAGCEMGFKKTLHPGVDMRIVNTFEQLVIDIDSQHMMDVLIRLCSGSAFHTYSGYVRSAYDYHQGELLIIVKDTGEGIPDVYQSNVFERFAAPNEQKRYGTGLSLPIVKEMVEQMGGKIDVFSKMGEGTTIWVTIPCEASEYTQATDLAMSHGQASGQKN